MNTLYFNISELITLESVVKKKGKHLNSSDLSLIKNACVITDENQILWAGTQEDIPTKFNHIIDRKIDCNQTVVTPALVDCHTHLVFAGNRSHEFVMRLSGATYEEIAAANGGIRYSSEQTNLADFDQLFQIASLRVDQLYQLGVCACEIKTGYSLTLDGEIKLLKVINKLKKVFKDKVTIHRTLMAAHAIPSGYTAETYIDDVVLPCISICAKEKLLDSVDVFHEINYFSHADVEKIFKHSKALNIDIRLHADELNNNQGAKLASTYQCLSADHLLKTDDEGAILLAKSNVIATLLPGTAFFLGKQLPNAKLFLNSGCAVAIASDFNPGSCYNNDVFQIARFSAPTLGLNPAVFWSAITYNAARSLKLENHGAIIPGFSAKLLKWNAPSHQDLLYDWTIRPECVHL